MPRPLKNAYSILLFGSLLVFGSEPGAESSINHARQEIARLRYDAAATELVDVAKRASGGERQEALFLLAGLKTSVSEAEIIYQEVIRIDADSDWANDARLELAKIQFATGNYNRAYGMLTEPGACDTSEEACYFHGLAALMLKRYGEARSSLSRVQRGRLAQWAELSLAETDAMLDEEESACDRYSTLSRSGMSPTAMYRLGECLEKQGAHEAAQQVFSSLVTTFRDTPEGVLARQKLSVMQKAEDSKVEPMQEATPPAAGQPGFTLQFGAFTDRTNAIKLAAELKPGLPGVRIDSDLQNNKEVHRVRYGYYADRASAERAAIALRNRIDEPVSIMTLP